MKSVRSLLFASSNANKLHEIRSMLPPGFEVRSLRDIGWTTDIPEPYNTFEENAAMKATTLLTQTGMRCFAEDSGLEVDALHGQPGVLSARYAGAHGDAIANNRKLLQEMKGIEDRRARFVAVIAFPVSTDQIHFFKGIVEGSVAGTIRGAGGFGYDPVFIPRGFQHTFGELPDSIKQAISHRRKALMAFVQYLLTEYR